MHDDIGVWLAARRMHQGRFVWPRDVSLEQVPLTQTRPQSQALVLGLPWQRVEDDGAIRLLRRNRCRGDARSPHTSHTVVTADAAILSAEDPALLEAAGLGHIGAKVRALLDRQAHDCHEIEWRDARSRS